MYEVRRAPFFLHRALQRATDACLLCAARHLRSHSTHPQYETSGQFQYADALGGEKAIGGGTGFERSVGVEAL